MAKITGPLLPEIIPTLPERVGHYLHDSHESTTNVSQFLYEHMRTAYEHDFLEFMFDTSEFMEAQHPDRESDRAEAFMLGMLFSVAVAESWLKEKDWKFAPKAVKRVQDDVEAAYERANLARPLGETVRFSQFLFDYGLESLQVAHGFREQAEAWAWFAEPTQIELHDYFLSGAGLMMKVALAAKHVRHLKRVEKAMRGVPDLIDDALQRLIGDEKTP